MQKDHTALYFVRSGYILLDAASTFRWAGINGFGWTSYEAGKDANGNAVPSASWLQFDAVVVQPSAGPYQRYHGFPLRCLSTI